MDGWFSGRSQLCVVLVPEVLGSIPNTMKKKRKKAQVFQKWRARSRDCVAAGYPLQEGG